MESAWQFIWGMLLGLFSVGIAVSAGLSGVTLLLLVLLLLLVVIKLTQLDSNKNRRARNDIIVPIVGIALGIVFVFLGVTPVSFDGFNPMIAYFISLYSVTQI